MTDVIYTPAGRAKEYAPLASNIRKTCSLACRYCYCPQALHVKKKDFFTVGPPKDDYLTRLKADCQKLRGDKRELLLCFIGDPYDGDTSITREALFILAAYDMRVTILTKNPGMALRDFRLIAENGWSLGTTLAWHDDTLRRQWEPNAASVTSRIGALIAAKQHGIRTWASVEPVLDTDEAIGAIIAMKDLGVDHFKVGKLNARSPELSVIEKSIDWGLFLERVEKELAGRDYYIKRDLEEHRKRE